MMCHLHAVDSCSVEQRSKFIRVEAIAATHGDHDGSSRSQEVFLELQEVQSVHPGHLERKVGSLPGIRGKAGILPEKATDEKNGNGRIPGRRRVAQKQRIKPLV